MAQAWQVLVQALRASSSRAVKCLSSSSCGDHRRALQRLAAAVMWRDGVPMPQVVKGTLDATVLKIMEELQERISVRMHEQVVDASVLMTVHQPGNQARRVPTDLLHRQGCCRHACGDAATGPSDSDKSRVKSLPRRKDITSNGRSLACGASLPVVKTLIEEKGEVFPWRRTRRRLRCGSAL